MSQWAWKVSDPELNLGLNLRYEPGNWGDVLKGTWALVLAQQLAPGFTYLDPFAGAPDYPLLEPVVRRLQGLGDDPFVAAQRPFFEAGRLASTAGLMAAAGAQVQVFDLDVERRSRWSGALEISSAEDALELPADLLLWDPYDFAERWSEWAAALVKRARACPVLIYLYSKASRGVNQARQYEDMRRRLQGVSVVAGRVPSDARLPRAYHEMILLDDTGLLEKVREPLRVATLRLARHLAEAGAWDD